MADLLRGKGLLKLEEGLGIKALGEGGPNQLPSRVERAVGDADLVGDRRILRADQAHPIEPVLSAEIDGELVFVLERVVDFEVESRAMQAVGELAAQEVGVEHLVLEERTLGQRDDIVTQRQHLNLSQAGPFATIVAHRSSLGLRQQ